MSYWILSLTEENFKTTVKSGLIGMGSKKQRSIEKMAVGDHVTFYIGKKSYDAKADADKIREFRGIAEITGDVIESEEPLWPVRGEDVFPWRREVSFVDSECSAFAPPVACDLSVVSNPLYWMLPFRGGHVKITKTDWELITGAMKEQS